MIAMPQCGVIDQTHGRLPGTGLLDAAYAKRRAIASFCDSGHSFLSVELADVPGLLGLTDQAKDFN